jgi:DNA invertase Pin-like site-specific DNA recombinase
METAAIYCRLSDEDRDKAKASDDSESIQNQKALLTRYAARNGWDVFDIYSDDDYSGLDRDRPEFNRLLRDAEGGRFNIILCKHQSRFTRDMELVEKYLHGKFIEWGIRFIGVTDNTDTAEAGSKKARQINGLVNEWYCEDISEAIKAAFKVKRESGRFIGSFAAYGYSKDPADKNRLVIDESAAAIVRGIYSLYLEGYGTQSIARMLNNMGVPSPSAYKRGRGLKFRNSAKNPGPGLWNKTAVRRILTDELYIGTMAQGKKRKVNYKSKRMLSIPKGQWIKVPLTHPAIIDAQKFTEVQGRMASRVRSTGRGRAHIFSGKVRCMDCGSTMNKVNSGNYSYLRCKQYVVDPKKGICASHSIRLDSLMEAVSQRIHSYMGSLSSHNLARSLQSCGHPAELMNSLKAELAALTRDTGTMSDALKSLYIDRVKGIVSESQFNELNTGFLKEKERMLQRKSKVERRMSELAQKASDTGRWMETISRYKDFKELTPAMINLLVDYIEIGDKSKASGEQRIRIHWLF